MKNLILSVLILAVCPVAFANDAPVDQTPARDRPELVHQYRQVNKEARSEKASAWRRYKARKFDLKAKALREADEKK